MTKILLHNFKQNGKIVVKKGQAADDLLISSHNLQFIYKKSYHLTQDQVFELIKSYCLKQDFKNHGKFDQVKSGGMAILAKKEGILLLNPDKISKIFKASQKFAQASLKNHSRVAKGQVFAHIKLIDLLYTKYEVVRFIRDFLATNYQIVKKSKIKFKVISLIDQKNSWPKQSTNHKIESNIKKKLAKYNLVVNKIDYLNYQNSNLCNNLQQMVADNKLIFLTLPSTIKNKNDEVIVGLKKLGFIISRLGINIRPGNHSVIARKKDCFIFILPISSVVMFNSNNQSSLDFFLTLYFDNNLTSYLLGKGISNVYFGKLLINENSKNRVS